MCSRILIAVEVRIISWNLFHGRDHAPSRSLHSWRSRLLRTTERGSTHAQVNRDLFRQFAGVLAGAEWDVALLQECPPRWAERLATECGAEPHLVLTSRNLPAPLDSLQALAARLNPDLIASWEGGCNLTLVRSADPRRPAISERSQFTLTRSPETRRMALTRLPGLCVANLHASVAGLEAEAEVARAAEAAVAWAAETPLLLGGDLNLRPSSSGALFDQLETNFGLSGATGPDAIDHLLAGRGLERSAPTRAWEAERREVPDPTAETEDGAAALPIRLSDHAPVEASFALASR